MIELLIGGIILFIVGVGSTIVYDKYKTQIVEWYAKNIFPGTGLVDSTVKFISDRLTRNPGPDYSDDAMEKAWKHYQNPNRFPGPNTTPAPEINRQPTASEIANFNNLVKQFDKQIKAQIAQAQKLQSQATKLAKTQKTISAQEFQKRLEDMKKKK